MRNEKMVLRLSRRAMLGGLIAASLPHAAYAQLSLGSLFGKKPDAGKDAASIQKKPADKLKPGKQGLFAGGYSQRFEPLRVMIATADYTDAIQAFVPPAAPTPTGSGTAPETKGDVKAPLPEAHHAVLTSDPFLANVELGLIAFEAGQLDEAVDHLKKAEILQDHAKGLGHTLGRGFGWFGSKVTGQGELAPYHPLDYEAVLQLNYLALAHLMKGQPTCYNVARRCIDFQQEIKARFEKEIDEAKAKLARQDADEAKKPPPKDQAARDEQATEHQTLNDFTGEFKAYDSYAGRVPNAYVNPLGDYLAGVIQEIASREQDALRDNSRIAYENAVALCGRSSQLSAAAAAMKRARVPNGERVVHVIVGEGFAPERRELFFVLGLVGQLLPVRVPIFTPVASPIEAIDVHVGSARLAVLDPIGDFEAIRMRSQQDRVPLLTLDVTVGLVASYMEGKAAHKFGPLGDVLYGGKELASHADTRSWLSLPRRFHVARVALPAAATSITLGTLGKAGQRLASQRVEVPKGESHTVVYARAVDGQITVHSARRLWIDGKLEIDTHA